VNCFVEVNEIAMEKHTGMLDYMIDRAMSVT